MRRKRRNQAVSRAQARHYPVGDRIREGHERRQAVNGMESGSHNGVKEKAKGCKTNLLLFLVVLLLIKKVAIPLGL